METGFAADGLTVTMIFSCLFVDTQNLFMLLFVQNYKFMFFLIGNVNHPNVSFFPCVLGFKIEREYPAPVCI